MIEEITSPPFLDDTAQEMVTKLQAIANNINNNAGQVSYSNTSSQLQAETVQTAIDEVKGITDTISSSLAQSLKAQQVQFILPQPITLNANSSSILLDHFDLSASTITDTIFTNKTLAQLFGGHTVLGVVGLWCSSGLIPLETIVWKDTNELTIRFYNQASTSITVSAIRLLVLYS